MSTTLAFGIDSFSAVGTAISSPVAGLDYAKDMVAMWTVAVVPLGELYQAQLIRGVIRGILSALSVSASDVMNNVHTMSLLWRVR